MSKYKKQSHVIYKFDYYIVWVPKYRLRILKGVIKDMIESDIHKLCEWQNCEVDELSVQEDHVHLLVSVPPKVSISKLMGVLKGKLAIKLFKSYPKLRQKPYWGNHFCARGYFVSTIGLDEDMINKYVQHQEKEEKKIENEQQKFNF